MLRESALFLSEIVHRRHRRRECRSHFSFYSFFFSYMCTYMYKYTYTHVLRCMCVHICYILCTYVRMYAYIHTYIYILISDPNYRVNYRLILKNTHVYVHVQLQHTPGRQESWSSEILIMIFFSLFFFKTKVECTVYTFTLIVSATTIFIVRRLQKLNK